jgi:hypothetical protein
MDVSKSAGQRWLSPLGERRRECPRQCLRLCTRTIPSSRNGERPTGAFRATGSSTAMPGSRWMG